ncbi:MAG TPA: hypothetical protein PJ988_08165, partial [Anaerolinea sp.]|nr:hypothetical protein [Anaerolinea sp.]
MRIKILIFITSLLLTVSTLLTAGVALAALGPLHAGTGLFPIQDLAEEGMAAVTVDNYKYAQFRLELLERRIKDLPLAAGSASELVVLDSMQWQMDQAANGMTYLTDEAGQPLRERLVVDLSDALAVMSLLQYAPAQVPDEFKALTEHVTQLKERASDMSISLNALVVEGSFAAHIITKPSAAVSGAPSASMVDPRAVSFPAGGVAAAHKFFPLTGKHAEAQCVDCHTKGVYKGTPTDCTSCHTKDKPENHFKGECSDCHSTDAWKPAKFDHAAVGATDCVSCHTKDKPANHWEGQCSACHSTSAWKPATFNHKAAAAVDCAACH